MNVVAILTQTVNQRRKTKAAKREPNSSVFFNSASGTMHPVVRCKEHEGSRRPLLDICETNEYGEVRVPLTPPLYFLLVFPNALLFRNCRQPSKYTVTPTSRLKSRNRTRSSEKHDGWTSSSKRRNLLRQLMGMGMGLLQRCWLQMATAVLTHSARTAGRPSLHSSTRYHAQGHSHVIGVTLRVGHRCRSPMDITRSGLAHRLAFNYLYVLDFFFALCLFWVTFFLSFFCLRVVRVQR